MVPLADSEDAEGAFRGKPGLIVFDGGAQKGGGAFEEECGAAREVAPIQTVHPNGRGIHLLGYGIDPAFSPDGRRIAYGVCDGSQTDLMIMDRDGSHVHPVQSTPASEEQPAFSSDGRHLVFVRDRGGEGPGDIYSVALDGSRLRRLTYAADENAAASPQVAANGRYVVFSRSGKVFRMHRDGSHQRTLARGVDPTIAPDSHRIAFSRGGRICLVTSAGGHVHALTHFRSRPGVTMTALSPAFSPNGHWIVFAVERAKATESGHRDSQLLMKVSLRGGPPQRLTTATVGGFHPDWQAR